MLTPMPHQETGSKWLAEREAGLLHWDMGTGKTLAAINALDRGYEIGEACDRHILILCPAVARRNWQREILVNQKIKRPVVVVESGLEKDRENLRKILNEGHSAVDVLFDEAAPVIIVSYDLMARRKVWDVLAGKCYDALILDELQYCKNWKTQRTRAVFGHSTYDKSGLVGRAHRVWALSGTPAPNNIAELHPWISRAAPRAITVQGSDRPQSYQRFVSRYCKTMQTPFGVKITGHSKEATDLAIALQPTTNRVQKEKVLHDLPPVRFHDLVVPGSGGADKVRAFEEENATELNAIHGVLEAGQSPLMSDSISTLRRMTEVAKIKDCIDLVSGELRDGDMKKVVIFTNHIEAIELITEGLEGFGAVQLRGATSPEKRQQAIDDFNNDPKTKVFVGQTLAAGTAITLHASGDCQDVIFVGCDWGPANNAQAAARVHRKGQTNSVLVRFLVIPNSIDERITQTLIRKSQRLNEFFNEKENHHAA